MKFTYKHADMKDANAWFATIAKTDTTIAIDLHDSTIAPLGDFAAHYPRSDRSEENFLVFGAKETADKVQKWWRERQEIEFAQTLFTIVDGKKNEGENDINAIGVSAQDHRLYRLIWKKDQEVVVPFEGSVPTSLHLGSRFPKE